MCLFRGRGVGSIGEDDVTTVPEMPLVRVEEEVEARCETKVVEVEKDTVVRVVGIERDGTNKVLDKDEVFRLKDN